MDTNQLKQAVSQIKQGNMLEAQNILEGILSANPQDLTAWSWYVKTYPTSEKRIKALRLCLQYNPENEQVKQALEKLKSNAGPFSDAKPIKIRYLYIPAILILIVEVALFIIVLSMHLGTGSLIILIPLFVLASIQVLAIGAIAPIYMLYKTISQLHAGKQSVKTTHEEHEKHNEVRSIWDDIKNSWIHKKKQWFAILGIIATGSLASLICLVFLLLHPNKEFPIMLADGTIDPTIQYTLSFWFIVGANVASLVIVIFNRVYAVIKNFRQKAHAA